MNDKSDKRNTEISTEEQRQIELQEKALFYKKVTAKLIQVNAETTKHFKQDSKPSLKMGMR